MLQYLIQKNAKKARKRFFQNSAEIKMTLS